MRSKPFRFKLQKVLDYRSHVEDKLKAELAELRLERERLEGLRASLRQSVADAIEKLRRAEFNVLTVLNDVSAAHAPRSTTSPIFNAA